MAGSICDSSAKYISQLSELLSRLNAGAIDRFADVLYRAWRDDRRVFIFGNGGSALTASHQACDLLKTAAVDGQRRLQVLSLVDNFGLTTALGNDISYDQVFRYPLETYAKRGDVAIAISASGDSPNVLIACEWARKNGVFVAALTGFAGGKLAALADLHVNIPSDNYGLIEDLQLSVGHIAAQILKSSIARQC
jgi:D-sedoheptulose 7-phosphate isomerase